MSYHNFDTVILQGNDNIEIDEADTMTIGKLVHLRDIRDIRNDNFSVVTELFDGKNYELIESNQSDDFIISDRILSTAVAQVSEDKLLGEAFRELFRPGGRTFF